MFVTYSMLAPPRQAPGRGKATSVPWRAVQPLQQLNSLLPQTQAHNPHIKQQALPVAAPALAPAPPAAVAAAQAAAAQTQMDTV